tara:strand:+ start:176 stop:1060 length:885 start_codon:yes stop_codon:yes gene_type:complete
VSRLHLAGVIPVANLKTDFEIRTPEILLPINAGFTAIQKSVFECAMAGCKTIWIVANDDLAPLVRDLVGEWTYDPVYYSRPSKFNSEQRREIPIYYVPIHPKDRDRRDSYGWSVLYGIHSAWSVANNISKWLIPEKYYVSFPMSVYDINQIRQHRRLISNPESNFFLMSDRRGVKQNKPIAFTMTGEDFKKCRRFVNKKTTREFLPPGPDQQYPSERLPLEERWSARYFELKDVFKEIDETNANKMDLDWYYDISNWSGYRNFLASDFSIETPNEDLTKPRKHVKIPYRQNESN